MNGSDPSHWQKVYTEKAADEVSWFQESPSPSLEALERLGAAAGQSLIDVGGGASNFVDVLLDRGWRDLTVLDISSAAMEAAKSRLGSLASKVEWVVADITQWNPDRQFEIWHDRAVFHFLTEPAQREAYRRALAQGTAKQSRVIVATFAPDGPEKCSGLPVRRYDAGGMARELGDMFRLVEDWREEHITPWGTTQAFTWCAFQRER